MPDRIEHLERLLRERIVIIDGAMGTMIQQRKLDEAAFRGARFADWRGRDLKGLNDLLNVTQPAVIEDIHRLYLEAGADIIETNTFNSQSISLADYGMESLAYELSKAGAECARRAADRVEKAQPGRVCFVAGAIGPTTKTSSISTDVNNPGARGTNYDELVKAYGEQINGLLDGGADVLLVETIFRHAQRPGRVFCDSEDPGRARAVSPALCRRDQPIGNPQIGNPQFLCWPPSPSSRRAAIAA